MNNMKQQGFTLVELIIVIVILGILAVTAAPRFLNMSGEATRAVLTSVQSSLETGVRFANNKALIQGLLNAVPDAAEASDNVDGIHITHGYPDSSPEGVGSLADLPTGWVAVYYDTTPTADITATEITNAGIKIAVLANASGGNPAYISAGGVMRFAPSYDDISGTCYLEYTSAFKASATDAVTPAKVTATTTGCD
jgi:MSHA pilin protein MshA